MTEQERDRNNNAIDLLIALTVEELAKISGRDPSQLMGDFLRSRTAAILCDEETKLCHSTLGGKAQNLEHLLL